METLSCRTLTDGILVDITTRYARVQPPGDVDRHDFEYNIRVVSPVDLYFSFALYFSGVCVFQ